MQRSRILKTTGIILLAVGASAAVGTLIVRDQLERHRRGLFSPRALRRFAALGYIANATGSVELVQLLRDFVAWEPRGLLRKRAQQILDRMEREVGSGRGVRAGFAG